MRLLSLLLLLLGAAFWPQPASAEVGRLAFVEDDASLRIGNKRVRLYGIYVPLTDRTCETRLRPGRCGSRAALALDFRLQGFVYCDFLGYDPDGSRVAVCEANCSTRGGRCREDLGAWLISQGWAVATSEAPLEYQIREEVARRRGRGIWGFQADSLTFR